MPSPPDLWAALGGGALIGSAAVLLLLCNGRVAGISGIVAHVLHRPDGERGWRLAFLAGLLGGSLLATAVGAQRSGVSVAASVPMLAVAGLLVGYGTRLGSGCTSGHGVCGLGRLSPRSMAAVATFVTVAGLTVFIARHVLGAPA